MGSNIDKAIQICTLKIQDASANEDRVQAVPKRYLKTNTGMMSFVLWLEYHMITFDCDHVESLWLNLVDLSKVKVVLLVSPYGPRF